MNKHNLNLENVLSLAPESLVVKTICTIIKLKKYRNKRKLQGCGQGPDLGTTISPSAALCDDNPDDGGARHLLKSFIKNNLTTTTSSSQSLFPPPIPQS
jgi:hypothetical protein